MNGWQTIFVKMRGKLVQFATKWTENESGQVACFCGNKFGPSFWISREYIDTEPESNRIG